MAERTKLPFPAALRQLMEERQLTFRRLAEMTRTKDSGGAGLDHRYLSMLANGRTKVALRGMLLVAAALDLSPTYFVEYRIEQIRRTFDRDDPPDWEALVDQVEQFEAWIERQPSFKELAYRLRDDESELHPALQHLERPRRPRGS